MSRASKELRKQQRKVKRRQRKLDNLPAIAPKTERDKLLKLVKSSKTRLDAMKAERPAVPANRMAVSRLTPALGAPHPDYTKDDGFYNSREWRQLRYLALKNTDGRCGCCGASANDGIRIHVDHIQPRYKRPDLSLDLANLQVLCEDCNCGKGAWDQTDWRAKF